MGITEYAIELVKLDIKYENHELSYKQYEEQRTELGKTTLYIDKEVIL